MGRVELHLDGLDAGGPFNFNLFGIFEFLLYLGWIFAIPLVGCFTMFYIIVFDNDGAGDLLCGGA